MRVLSQRRMRSERGTAVKFAYADPPYLGCALALYGDATYDAPEAHLDLIARLCDGYPDGWAYSLSSTTLQTILPFCPSGSRVGAWVKPFASFKPNVNPAYAWEPVIFRGGRRRDRKEPTARDWHSEPITLRRGLTGAKPPGFARWIVDLLGVDFEAGDTIDDLFPGTGFMTQAFAKAQQREFALDACVPAPFA